MNDPVIFYKTADEFGCFSNFSRHPFEFADMVWPTSEHLFQAAKFMPLHPELAERVRRAATPKEAAAIGRDPSNPIRRDWDSLPRLDMELGMLVGMAHDAMDDGIERPMAPEPVFARYKDVMMFDALLAKFMAHQDLQETLKSTQGRPIIEGADVDAYWGWGADHKGLNKLGRLLMMIRYALVTV